MPTNTQPRRELRTPLDRGRMVPAGPANTWRKQVLPIGEWNIDGTPLNVTRAYCEQVVAAHRDKAFDTSPIMLADRGNTHTMALLDGGGEVLDLDVQPDGLWSTVRLSQAASDVVADNPRVGCSVRIKEGYTRPDGRHYPAALQHLLLTWDPKITGMSPWQPADVELSNGEQPGVVIDLSAAVYDTQETDQEGAVMPTATATPPQFTADELATLRAAQPLLERLATDPAASEVEGQLSIEDTLTEDDLQRLAAAEVGTDDVVDDMADDGEDTATADEGDTDDAGAGDDTVEDGDAQQDADAGEGEQRGPVHDASNPAGGGNALELANAARDQEVADLRLAHQEMTERVDAATYREEREQIARTHGIPPHIVDLAQPLLKGARRVVSLSNGDEADAGEIIRQVFAAIGEHVKLLDLSSEFATSASPTPADEVAAQHRSQVKTAVLQGIGVN